MKKFLTALVLTGGLAAAHANAATCTYPTAPGKFPDGSQATKDEMLAAKKLVVQYNSDMDAYLACIKEDYDARVAAAPDASADKKSEAAKKEESKYNDKYNEAVKEVTDVTERFNEQLRAWKAKNQPAEKKPS
jgi:hypothetical protein